jgi:hypothetical protein
VVGGESGNWMAFDRRRFVGVVGRSVDSAGHASARYRWVQQIAARTQRNGVLSAHPAWPDAV